MIIINVFIIISHKKNWRMDGSKEQILFTPIHTFETNPTQVICYEWFHHTLKYDTVDTGQL